MPNVNLECTEWELVICSLKASCAESDIRGHKEQAAQFRVLWQAIQRRLDDPPQYDEPFELWAD